MGINIGPAGLTMDDKLINLIKGWFVVYKDGSLVTEDEIHWNNVKKNNICVLGLKWFDKFWTLTGKSAYLQFKRGSVSFYSPGESSDINCEERCIGYYEGSSKVVYRVNERTGVMTPGVL